MFLSGCRKTTRPCGRRNGKKKTGHCTRSNARLSIRGRALGEGPCPNYCGTMGAALLRHAELNTCNGCPSLVYVRRSASPLAKAAGTHRRQLPLEFFQGRFGQFREAPLRAPPPVGPRLGSTDVPLAPVGTATSVVDIRHLFLLLCFMCRKRWVNDTPAEKSFCAEFHTGCDGALVAFPPASVFLSSRLPSACRWVLGR